MLTALSFFYNTFLNAIHPFTDGNGRVCRIIMGVVAQSPILTTTITLQRLKKKGYQSMLDVYMELNPSLCEPPYTRTVRMVV
ncbi:Fic family protein [Flavobacterium sp. ZS1P14]|uniref:Fic family protein n=1 Tax=Flavobacterium sp. ZS1P14 TaxID=3401729 RepID=UPI003AAB7A51